MTRCTGWLRSLMYFACMLCTFVCDALRCLRPSPVLAADNLFLRKQLALYQERHVKPRRATNVTRLALVWLALWFDWRHALAVVQPETFTRWHHQGSRLFWRWKSRPGRPAILPELQTLMRQMARDNPTWGQGRIANEPLFTLGLRVLKTPSRCPQANTICERGLGTRRRDALDFVMPLTANHLRRMQREWVVHDNQDCPHMSLGPGMPQPPVSLPVPLYGSRYRLPAPRRAVTRPILGGLHHAYGRRQKAA